MGGVIRIVICWIVNLAYEEKKEGKDLKNIVLGQISTIAIFAFSLHWQSHSTKNTLLKTALFLLVS